MNELKTVFQRNLWRENPVIRQILGICSALAVTNRVENSLVMGVGLMFVTAFSSLTLSALRNAIPDRIRMIVQTLVIAAYVIIVDIFIKANLPEISAALGPYVGLIITNCIIMGRAEAFARKNPPVISFFDGLFAGIGYTVILLCIALVREILGFGTIFGYDVNFLNFTNWTIMVVPPGAFFMIAILIWVASGVMNRRNNKEAKAGGK